MLCVSTIEPRKGHGQLVEAFNILRQEGLDIDLTIIGRRGWDSTSLINSWSQHPDFETRLRWLESPDDLILRTHAQLSSIGVCPSMDEGFGLFVEEGLALGLKMVVSDIPVFRERHYTNMIFSKRDPASLARAILAAHRSPWIEPTTPIRLMSDFVEDFFDLINQVIEIPVGRSQRA
jgi:glycosyltransferase involved in cell wall biosynthesis